MFLKIIFQGCLATSLVLAISSLSLAQVVPDKTLGSESSVINSITELRSLIEGGATRGENLFHSFENFSIGEGLSVYFANPEGIANIFSRVTGNNISEILGTLGVEGTANLFFLNPNGIIFGENAFIDVGGSFIATTANSIEFSDGTNFNSRRENQKPLLTWNAPIGLGLDNNLGAIKIQGNGHQLTFANPEFPLTSPITGGGSSQNGLKVNPNQTLALVGGQINIDGGVLTSPSGNIEIGAVEQGKVKLNWSNNTFDYNEVTNFGDIVLDNYALLDASGLDNSSNGFAAGGIINLQGKNLLVNNGSLIFISNLGEDPFSQININVSETANFTGITSPISFGQGREEITRGIISDNFSSTKGANISISAKNLILKDFSLIVAQSYRTHLRSF